MKSLIYLDFNASTPIAPEVAEAMRPYLAEHYGNPSSRHWAGAPAKTAVEAARGQVATLTRVNGMTGYLCVAGGRTG